jgi:hypothetical protein
MRGLIEGQAASTPIESVLPAMLADDPFAQRLCAALDEVLAPMTSALDNLDAYLDPRTAPPDFLRWLAGWVGVDAAASLDESTLRQRVLQAPRTHSYAARLAPSPPMSPGRSPADRVRDGRGHRVVSWSRVPGGTAPGRARDDQGDLVVRVRSDLPSSAVARRSPQQPRPPVRPRPDGAAMITCTSCGHANEPGDSFCGSCSTFLSGQATAPGAAPAPLPVPSVSRPEVRDARARAAPGRSAAPLAPRRRVPTDLYWAERAARATRPAGTTAAAAAACWPTRPPRRRST